MYMNFNMKNIKWLLCLAILLGAGNIQAQKDNHFEISKNLDVFNAIVKEAEMFYVDSLDIEKTVRRGIDAMLKGLDPYTEYYPEQEMDVLKLITTGEYGGVGAIISQREEGVCINEPYEGMPAALAGLRAGDLLVEVDGVDVAKKTTSEVSDLLKGQPNSKFKVKYLRPGEKKPKEVELTRKLVVVDPVTYYGVRNDSVGYIYLKTFSDKSAQGVRAAFEDLKKNHNIKSLILDLRGNGGGLLDGAVQLVSWFVPKGNVVLSTKGKMKQWDRTYRTANEPIDTVIPLVVLVDNNSASASEIVSGALQDLDRAVLVGERTYGKGLVQSTRELPYNGSLKVTMSKYYIPSGRCIQAIDYTHRNPDGSVGRIPDSLTTVFKTAIGRPVRDGGGVSPDFAVEGPKMPTLMYYLVMENTIFDYATDYVQKHKTIAPIDEFVFTDADYESFKEFVKKKDFKYDRQSEKMLKDLKEVAEFEGYLDSASEEYKALEAKLTPNLERDLERFKKQIKEMLSAEIAKRYYFQRGEMIETLKDDPVLDKALEVLADPALYNKTLAAPESTKADPKADSKPAK